MRARLMTIAAAALAAAALTGCASGDVEDSNAYVAAVNEAQSTFTATSERLRDAIEPGEAGGDPGSFREFYDAVDAFVRELRGIEAPPSVRALHERLIATMVRFGDDLRSAGAKVTSGNAGKVLDGQQELADASRDVTRSLNTTFKAINATLQQ